jgi:four helix bundle protein
LRIDRRFLKDERYELNSQLNRASNSISQNIREGNGETIPMVLKILEGLECSTIAFRKEYISKTE